MSPRNFMNT